MANNNKNKRNQGLPQAAAKGKKGKKKQKKQANRRATGGVGMGLRHLHPGLYLNHHSTESLRSTPYTVVNDRMVTQMSTSTTASTWTIALLGTWDQPTLTPGPARACCYGMIGSGTGVPFVTETYLNSVNMSPVAVGRNRLHRLAVRLVHTGSTGTSAIPDGITYVGLLRTPIDRGSFATYNALGGFLQSRPEMRAFSNYELFTKGVDMVMSSSDFLEWQSFKYIGLSGSGASLAASPAMGTLAIASANTVSAGNLTITVQAEWTVEYTADPVLQGTARHHSHVEDSVWHEASKAAHGAAGVIENVVSGLASLVHLRDSFGPARVPVRRGLPIMVD